MIHITKRVEEVIEEIIAACKAAGATRVFLFGSRARGNAGERSDIDIAVCGVADIFALEDAIDEIDTIYKIDLVDLDTCGNELLIEDVKKYGKQIL